MSQPKNQWFLRAKRLLRLGSQLVLGLFCALAALRLYYHWTPTELSAQAQQWSERAQSLPKDTDNGLRMLGLLAPEGTDPMVYGSCLLAAERRYAKGAGTTPQAVLSSAHMGGSIDDSIQGLAKQREKDQADCSQGGLALSILDVMALPSPTVNQIPSSFDWKGLAKLPVHSVLLPRYADIMEGGVRYLGHTWQDPVFQNSGVLVRLHRIQLGQAVDKWTSGQQHEALSIWERSTRQWTLFAPDSLLASMLTLTALSETLASIHAATNSVPPNENTLSRLLSISHALDAMPDALAATSTPEWAFMVSLPTSIPPTGNWLERTLSQPFGAFFDTTSTLNSLALNSEARTQRMKGLAQGLPAHTLPQPEVNESPFCRHSLVLCLALDRNPIGWILAHTANPSYDEHGLRTADVLNFAAATRLVLSARQQQVTADALPQWVQQVPANMRDIYTGQPFAVEPAGNAVLVNLKHRNSFLGEPGAYRLPL